MHEKESILRIVHKLSITDVWVQSIKLSIKRYTPEGKPLPVSGSKYFMKYWTLFVSDFVYRMMNITAAVKNCRATPEKIKLNDL